MRELPGEVEQIVLPTFAVEHKQFVGPFSRAFPKAKVHVAPRCDSLAGLGSKHTRFSPAVVPPAVVPSIWMINGNAMWPRLLTAALHVSYISYQTS